MIQSISCASLAPEAERAGAIPLLSVVTIGRNEARNVTRVCDSVKQLKAAFGKRLETIFVDSASRDETAVLARDGFDLVITLKEDDWLSASAGRAVGTLHAKGEWILYLDGDMALADEFRERLSDLISNTETTVVGYVGGCRNVYPSGRVHDVMRAPDRLGVQRSFGGACLLRRLAVIDAGNWDAALAAHEELDLCGRLIRAGGRIENVSGIMVKHFPVDVRRDLAVARLFVPSAGLGKKFNGIGQLVAARARNGWHFMDLIKLEPYPFMIIGVLAIAVILWSWSSALALAMIAAVTSLVVYGRGWSGLLIAVSWIFRIPFGLRTYRKNYMPEIDVIWERE